MVTVINLDIIKELEYEEEDSEILENIKELTDRIKLSEIVDEMSLSINTRMKAFSKLYDIYKEDIIEEINKLCGIYIYSGSKYVEEFLHKICDELNDLPLNFKNIIANNLCSRGEKIGYSCLSKICSEMDMSVSTPLRIESIKTLLEHSEYVENAIACFKEIIKLETLNDTFKYKTILSLENNIIKEEEEKEEKEEKGKGNSSSFEINLSKNSLFALNELMYFFFVNVVDNYHKILSAQYLLINNCEYYESIEKEILEIALNKDSVYNIRADASDMLLRLSKSEDIKEKAKNIIYELGNNENGVARKAKTIFENAQNAHYDEIEDSVLEALEFLNGIDTLRIKDYGIIDFTFVKNKIKTYMETVNVTSENKEKINISLNRIELDRIMYSKYNFTLKAVLVKVWTYIENSEFAEEMKKRLVEELIAMCGICSTGFISYTINTISGFGDFNYKISWKDQIVSNFVGRLNFRARNILEKWNTTEKMNIIVDSMILKEDDMLSLLKKHITVKKLEYEFIIRDNYGNAIKNYNKQQLNKMVNDVQTSMYSNKDYPSHQELRDYFIEENIKNKNMLDDDMINEFILEEFQSGVLSEISEDNSVNNSRNILFSTFLREELISIREEMYIEFKEYIEDSEFDIYFRDAISVYETGLN